MTFDGKSDNKFKTIYQSPDGQFVVAFQAKSPSPSKLYMIEAAPKNQFPPRLRTEDYLRPGDDIELMQPRLFNLASRKEVPLDNSLFDTPYAITNIGWAANSDKYWFLYNQRGHQRLRIVEISLHGATRAVVDESSPTFIDYNQKLYYKLLPSTNELIWASERDNYNHLYMIRLNSGEVKHQITQGEWNVRHVHRVDCERRQIWFECVGIVPGQDPYYSHLACVDFDGTDFRVITQGDGTHQWKWGPNHRFIIDAWSRVDDQGEIVVRDAQTGQQVVSLHGRAEAEMYDMTEWSAPERFSAPGRDGHTAIHGMIIRPKEFDCNVKYPILEFIYAGPQSFITPKGFADMSQFRKLADDAGFIVVMSDGMGTNWRSKSFHDVCYKNHRDGGFPDRMAWISAAAATRPWMDLTRVGCYGSSHGGYDAACAAIHYSDFYTAAMASAGNHDHRMGHLQWNEMWMGYPVDESYVENSNVTHAAKLGAKLMLVAGGLDNNVDPAATLRLADGLIKADKDFDLVFVPSGDHYVHSTPWVIKKQLAFFKRHLA